MGKIVVGCWDCDYCGADRISGEIKICPNCGKPRGKDITFYMAGPKKYVEDPDNAIHSIPTTISSAPLAARRGKRVNRTISRTKRPRKKRKSSARKLTAGSRNSSPEERVLQEGADFRFWQG